MFCFFFFVHYNNGDFMRRILFFFLLFLFFIGVKANSYLLNEDSYDLHTLSFDNLSTNNFLDYFSDISVIRLYPYVNPIYRESIGDLVYEVRGNLSDEINKFKEQYLNIIKKNSYLDYNYLYTNGINISKMDVYVSDKQLNNILNSGLLVYSVK